MVTQRASGANMSVDINMPGGGCAFVQGDTITGQGLYRVDVHSANINETIATANATNPRIDQVILEIQDDTLDASGGNLARTRVLTGTATSGATLANRSGAATLPGSALLLADVLVAANATTIPNTAIRDRRKWARGAYTRLVRTVAESTTSTSLVLFSAGAIAQRIECSGVPVRARVQCTASNDTAAQGGIFDMGMDGTLQSQQISFTSALNSAGMPLDLFWDLAPAAGSHTFCPMLAAAASGTLNVAASAAHPIVITIEEIVRQSTANNAVTSG